MKHIWTFFAIVVITPVVQSQVRVSAGANYTCAITPTTGRVFCWGLNNRGQLGTGSTVDDLSTPTAIRIPRRPLNERITSFIDISAGYQHACALTTDGKIFCWGDNVHSQLGADTPDFTRVPRLVQWPFASAIPTTFQQLSAGGDHTCALAAGKVYCWGGGAGGQLGNGMNPISSSVPMSVSLPRKVTQVSAGWLHTCALTDAGEVYCWGVNNHGQLGDGTKTIRNSPVKIDSTLAFVSISAGMGFHTCGVAKNGQAYCWGFNDRGQMGNGTVGGEDSLVPSAVVDVKGFASISAGERHNCAKKSSDISFPPNLPAAEQVYCWGTNASGELGNGTPSLNEPSPTAVRIDPSRFGTVRFLSAGFEHTCVRTSRRTTLCWGSNGSGQIGDGTKTNRPRPTVVAGLPD